MPVMTSTFENVSDIGVASVAAEIVHDHDVAGTKARRRTFSP
jgi:hypothetical protein